jgi:hypothetical protein
MIAFCSTLMSPRDASLPRARQQSLRPADPSQQRGKPVRGNALDGVALSRLGAEDLAGDLLDLFAGGLEFVREALDDRIQHPHQGRRRITNQVRLAADVLH